MGPTISTAVLQVARGVDELLRGGGVRAAAHHLEVGATDDGELLGLAVRDPAPEKGAGQPA